MPGYGWERGKPGSRRFQAPQHGLEALDLVAKSLYVTRTFMGLSPGGCMNPGRDHEAEKSVYFADVTVKLTTPFDLLQTPIN
jgi:hypothetical protein